MHRLNRQRKIFSVDLLVILKLQPPFWSKANEREQRSFFLLICWPILDNTQEIVFENCSKKYSSWDNYYLWLKYEINFWSQWQVWLVLFFFLSFSICFTVVSKPTKTCQTRLKYLKTSVYTFLIPIQCT